jgi:alpha-mannosidase
MEEGDVNAPSAESIIRQILYGNQYFRREFGKTSAEYMLPDCFGFPASLPSILAHMGLKGFSTQKLTWGSAAAVGGPGSPENTPVGIPFNVGVWEGPDGRSIIAAFNPGSYGGQVREDISKSPFITDANARNNPVDWPRRVQLNGQVSGLFTDYHYYGTGDTGGAPAEASVKMMEAIVTKSLMAGPPPAVSGQPPSAAAAKGPVVKVGDGPLHVISATAEQMFLDIKSNQMDRLPRYTGDLMLTNHSAGSITSQTYQKRWNRKNELLADAAERASVAAAWLGGRSYPQQRLNNAWTLVMGGQFHDVLPGTATPKAFEFSWNDDVIAMNQFASVLTSATESIASGLNTQTSGKAIVVYNPLNIQREDVVEATIPFPNEGSYKVQVFGPDGNPVSAQLAGVGVATAKILFLANVSSVGYAVYDVRLERVYSGDSRFNDSGLDVTESSLENDRYLVRLDEHGDVTSIFDKSVDKELLAAPMRLAIKTDKPEQWPAWNMDWADQQKPPRAYVSGPAKIRIVENGPVRVAIEVGRETEGSTFVQTIRLSAGDAGNRVEFSNVIDWTTSGANLKATFPLTAANPLATYNWDVGTIQRGNNDEKKFEVPSHQWIDLTDKSGAYGVTILTDCKSASDKPDDSTLRLTLVRTPGISERAGYADQATQDWGHHEFVYGLAGHAGHWRAAQTDWQAQRLNQPLIAFESPKHPGALGRSFSLLTINNSRVRVLALKKAEESDEVIVRIVELSGEPQKNVRLNFPAPLVDAREVNGQEQTLFSRQDGVRHEVSARTAGAALITALGPYQLRTFALKLATPRVKLTPPQSQPVNLTYDQSVASNDATKSVGGFDAAGRALPAELLPNEIVYSSIRFNLAPAATGKTNALAAKGQTITLPPGKFTRLYVLAASADGDQKVTFRIGDRPVDLLIQNWGGFIGQWDDRNWKQKEIQIPPRTPPPGTPPDIAAQMQRPRTRIDPYGEMTGITPGFIKRAPVAWFASHCHTADGVNEAYSYAYLFAYAVDVPAGARTLTLPNNDRVRILAMTVANESGPVDPVQPLYDDLDSERRPGLSFLKVRERGLP